MTGLLTWGLSKTIAAHEGRGLDKQRVCTAVAEGI